MCGVDNVGHSGKNLIKIEIDLTYEIESKLVFKSSH